MTRKQKVADAFDAAATTYDSAARAQALAAERLVELVLAAPLPSRPTVLEVGCGTGLLTRRLLPRVGGDWLVTDLSPAMVAAAKDSVGAGNAVFRVMDAEHPDTPLGLFDLIVSNLAAQWFSDIGRTARQLRAQLAPGGRMVLSTLGHGSFAEWRAAHEQFGLACGTPDYPTAAALAAQLPEGAQVVSHTIQVPHADGLEFLDSLRRIGADTPATGHRPLTAGALRRVLRSLGAPVAITYHLLFAIITAE
jgi:malonyl-CoA O-methyltransferase